VALRLVALAGGVGGAKLVHGLARLEGVEELTVVVNTGDDFIHLGLRICPDLDTVTYTLAGLANPETGWGRADETWSFIAALQELNGPTWFRLGDRDLATHVFRTHRLMEGHELSAVTEEICESYGIQARLLPMTDDTVNTIVQTAKGDLPFQEYFVARACQPVVQGFRFDGVETAQPAPGVLESIYNADAVILSPSNPWVSLDPILAIPGIRDALMSKTVIGISPIIKGRALKGPAGKMFQELGIEPSATAVAQHYQDLLTCFVLDIKDKDLAGEISEFGISVKITDTMMTSDEKRIALAEEILEIIASQTMTEETQ
jgi:LPPG:FO 2-phospho-L-lactate transferase